MCNHFNSSVTVTARLISPIQELKNNNIKRKIFMIILYWMVVKICTCVDYFFIFFLSKIQMIENSYNHYDISNSLNIDSACRKQ